MRPGYFPFVEPGFEIDASCPICGGKGCSLCKKTGWIEIMGAGMLHPEVLRQAGVDPDIYSGYAFGMGINRLVAVKHRIKDIRLFTNGDLRFSRSFG
jgi:phenylalanyl-tRNA synthetase alpha chain